MSRQLIGLSHSEIPVSTVICTWTGLIAAYHVLHRLREPRHPPVALSLLMSSLWNILPALLYSLFFIILTKWNCLLFVNVKNSTLFLYNMSMNFRSIKNLMWRARTRTALCGPPLSLLCNGRQGWEECRWGRDVRGFRPSCVLQGTGTCNIIQTSKLKDLTFNISPFTFQFHHP